jgi:hypothetical protein
MGAERVDLGRVEPWAKHADHSAHHCEAGDRMLLRLVAELRVAREVVKQVHSYAAAMRRDEGAGDLAEEWHRLGTALDAYDQAAGPTPTPDRSQAGG